MSKEYKSQGTVRYYVGKTYVNIRFVPHSDYMITHEDKHYAVFLTGDGKECILRPCKEPGDPVGTEIYILEVSAIGTTVKTSDLEVSQILTLAGAQSAAMTNSKVEVKVMDNGKLKLTGITVPAK